MSWSPGGATAEEEPAAAGGGGRRQGVPLRGNPEGDGRRCRSKASPGSACWCRRVRRRNPHADARLRTQTSGTRQVAIGGWQPACICCSGCSWSTACAGRPASRKRCRWNWCAACRWCRPPSRRPRTRTGRSGRRRNPWWSRSRRRRPSRTSPSRNLRSQNRFPSRNRSPCRRVEKKPEPKVEKKPDPKPAPPDTRREIESQEQQFKEALARESAQQTQREGIA
jgi:hypothetical protein